MLKKCAISFPIVIKKQTLQTFLACIFQISGYRNIAASFPSWIPLETVIVPSLDLDLDQDLDHVHTLQTILEHYQVFIDSQNHIHILVNDVITAYSLLTGTLCVNVCPMKLSRIIDYYVLELYADHFKVDIDTIKTKTCQLKPDTRKKVLKVNILKDLPCFIDVYKVSEVIQ
jgi:hypothetical protein